MTFLPFQQQALPGVFFGLGSCPNGTNGSGICNKKTAGRTVLVAIARGEQLRPLLILDSSLSSETRRLGVAVQWFKQQLSVLTSAGKIKTFAVKTGKTFGDISLILVHTSTPLAQIPLAWGYFAH